MPVGPSHSGRGGGSRSSGGGSSRSFGGSRSSGGGSRSSGGGFFRRSSHDNDGPSYHGGGGFHFNRGPRRFRFFGRTVVLTSGFQFFIIFLAILAIVFGSLASFESKFVNFYKYDVSDIKSEIKIFKDDDAYFKNLINTASLNDDSDGYYLATATFDPAIRYTYGDNPSVPGVYYVTDHNGHQWHFIVFEYTNEVTGTKMKGTTYTQFSANQVNGMNGSIEIAYTKTDNQWWAINTSYSLASNKDYEFAQEDLSFYKGELSSARWKLTGYIFGVVVCVGLVVLIIVKKSKKEKAESEIEAKKAEAEVDEARAKASMAQRQAKQYGRVCKYCGNNVPDGESNCPGCGSSDFE